MTAATWGDIVFSDQADRAVLSRAVKRGTLRRLATGIYTGAIHGDPTEIARRHWREILAHELPGAVIADRSARTGRPDDDGILTVLHARRRPLDVAGLRILPRRDRAMDAGVVDLPDGTRMGTIARGLLDNLAATGERYLTRAEVERWLGDLLADHGEGRLNTIRDEARALALVTGRRAAFDRLDRIISAALATGVIGDVATPALRARASGQAYDDRRAHAFEALVAKLERLPPEPLTDLPIDAPRRRLLPFYEAYFSNFIEGTEFSIEEAAEIVFDGHIPRTRPADAQDVMGTYRLVADQREMRRIPIDGDAFIELLLERHGRMLAARPEARPGRLKDRANRAGSTTFVAPELVEGTLRVGHAIGRPLIDPFARAVYVMFLVTEVHPFTDGNGRIARIHMNAELVSTDMVRIVIPTVYRENYLSALKAATHAASFDPLSAMLRFAQRYTARIDFSTRPVAEDLLTQTHAFRDPRDAEDRGIRLVLP